MDEDVVAAGQGAPGWWRRSAGWCGSLGVVSADRGSRGGRARRGGLLWWAGVGWPGDAGGEEPRSDSSGDGRPTRVAFHAGVSRLVEFGSFAYRGDVHAVGQSAFRPGDPIALDVSVEGAVLLNHGLTREVAVDSMGRAGETVTSGPTMWTRSAATAEGLGTEPWEVRSLPVRARWVWLRWPFGSSRRRIPGKSRPTLTGGASYGPRCPRRTSRTAAVIRLPVPTSWSRWTRTATSPA